LNHYISYNYHDLHKYLNIKNLNYQIDSNLIIQNDGFEMVAKENGLGSIVAGSGNYQLTFNVKINNVNQTINIKNDFNFKNNLFDGKHVNFTVAKKNFKNLTGMNPVYTDD